MLNKITKVSTWRIVGHSKKFILGILLLFSQIWAQEKPIQKSLDDIHKDLQQQIHNNPVDILISVLFLCIVAYAFVRLVGWLLRKIQQEFTSCSWGGLEIITGFVIFYTANVIAVTVCKSFMSLDNEFLFGIIATLISSILFYTAMVIFLSNNHQTVHFGMKKISWWQILMIFLLYISFLPVYFISMSFSHILFAFLDIAPDAQKVAQDIMKSEGIIFTLGVTLAIVVAPICEEFTFRVFLYSSLRNLTGVIPAALLSSLIFASVHLVLLGFLPIFSLGLLLVFVYERTQNYWLIVLLHALHNTTTVVFLIAMKN